MQLPRCDPPRIIGALALALVLLAVAGCSALRFGYSQLPSVAYWRLDGYFDFDTEQEPRVRDAIAEWFRWHRATQIPEYATLAARARADAIADATPRQTCRWWSELGGRLDDAMQQMVPGLAPVAMTLTPRQLAHVERRYAKSIDEMRRDYLQSSADERRRASVRRAVERFEDFYGRLDDAQRREVEAAVAASPFDAERFIAERAARHQDSLAVLRRVVAPGTSAAEAERALREVVAQTLVSPRPAYREYQRALIDYNCAFAARIHNLTTREQRQVLRDKLAGWEADMRSLSNGS